MCSEVYEGIEQGLVCFMFKFYSLGRSVEGLVCMVKKEMTMRKSQQARRRAVRGTRDCQGETSEERLSVSHTQMTVYLLTSQFHDDVKMVLGERWKDVRQLLGTLAQLDREIGD